jgi:NADH-quinone oxidoreductase subunit J
MTPQQQYTVNLILLAAMVLCALWAVMTARLLRAVVGLALTSAMVTILMFMLGAPLAAVFELSVCAGLIPAIFLSVISVTRKQTALSMEIDSKDQIKKFWYLPVILALTAIALTQVHVPELAVKLAAVPESDVRKVLWNLRNLDLLGQIVILLCGAFGVVVLLKGPKND